MGINGKLVWKVESNVHYTNDSGTHKQVSPKGDKKDMFNLPLEEKWDHFRVEMKTKGMWVIFNVFVSDNFNTDKDGDILNYSFGMQLKNFKVNKL